MATPLAITCRLDLGVEEFGIMYWWRFVGFEYTEVVILRSNSSFWIEIRTSKPKTVFEAFYALTQVISALDQQKNKTSRNRVTNKGHSKSR